MATNNPETLLGVFQRETTEIEKSIRGRLKGEATHQNVQDVLSIVESACLKHGDHKPDGKRLDFILGIAKNKCRNFWKAHYRRQAGLTAGARNGASYPDHEECADGQMSPSDFVASKEIMAIVRQGMDSGLNSLGEKTRRAYVNSSPQHGDQAEPQDADKAEANRTYKLRHDGKRIVENRAKHAIVQGHPIAVRKAFRQMSSAESATAYRLALDDLQPEQIASQRDATVAVAIQWVADELALDVYRRHHFGKCEPLGSISRNLDLSAQWIPVLFSHLRITPRSGQSQRRALVEFLIESTTEKLFATFLADDVYNTK